MADPPARRLADRADQRPGAARFDRARGRQARRRAGGGVPRDASRPLRRDGCRTRAVRRAAQRQHRSRSAELDGRHPRTVPRASRLRPAPLAPDADRPARRQRRRVRPLPVRLPAHARRAARRGVLRHSRRRGAPARDDVLRRGARRRPAVTRRRPRDARRGRRADGCDVDVRARTTARGRPTSPT